MQFVSALADNALLIVAIARLLELAAADWTIPLLKLSFTLCYVFLAPFVGPLADAWPKGRVMVAANLLKLLAACLLLGGADPLLVLAVAGLGAAVYAPAKYGLITELLPADQLVRANGYIEGSTVCAVILGTVLGGALVSPLLRDLPLPEVLMAPVGTTTSLSAGMLGLLLLYGVATALNVGIVDSGVRYPRHSRHAGHMVQRFFSENRILWRDPLGGVSMAVTTLLWGIGATLQLVVLRWAEESLGLALSQAAYLQGVTAVGVIAGATWASQTVSLAGATRLLPLGIAMGLLVPCMASVQSLGWAAGLLMLVGAMAGYFVVPMNALLQHRGHALLTAGRSIAVQGFNENAGILLMLSLYAASTALQIALHQLLWCFGGLVASTMAVITLLHYRRRLLSLSSN